MALRPFSYYPQDVATLDPLSAYSEFGVLGRDVARLRSEAVKPLAPLMSADLIESGTEFRIHIDLPGAENLEITVDNGTLYISADRNVLHEINTDVAHKVERSYGRVRRSVPIPAIADSDRAEAKYVNGVLTITFPKTLGVKSNKIAVTQC